jgi:hypothetical protein
VQLIIFGLLKFNFTFLSIIVFIERGRAAW